MVFPIWNYSHIIISSSINLYLEDEKNRFNRAYTALAVIDYVVGFASGFASISSLVVSTIVIGLLYTQFKKMN